MNKITLDQVKEFYEFLKGKQPECIRIPEENRPSLSIEPAYNVIWFLQEHLRVLPDHFEKCSHCGELYDSNSEGHYNDEKYPGIFHCEGCVHFAPNDSFE